MTGRAFIMSTVGVMLVGLGAGYVAAKFIILVVDSLSRAGRIG